MKDVLEGTLISIADIARWGAIWGVFVGIYKPGFKIGLKNFDVRF